MKAKANDDKEKRRRKDEWKYKEKKEMMKRRGETPVKRTERKERIVKWEKWKRNGEDMEGDERKEETRNEKRKGMRI